MPPLHSVHTSVMPLYSALYLLGDYLNCEGADEAMGVRALSTEVKTMRVSHSLSDC